MPENINQGRWISLQEVCDYIGVKRHTVMRWIEQRGMPASKVGKIWRFKTADIDEWIKRAAPPMSRRTSNEQIQSFQYRALSVLGFSFLFSYLMAFLFEGQVLYGLLESRQIEASGYIIGAIAAHFAGCSVVAFL